MMWSAPATIFGGPRTGISMTWLRIDIGDTGMARVMYGCYYILVLWTYIADFCQWPWCSQLRCPHSGAQLRSAGPLALSLMPTAGRETRRHQLQHRDERLVALHEGPRGALKTIENSTKVQVCPPRTAAVAVFRFGFTGESACTC